MAITAAIDAQVARILAQKIIGEVSPACERIQVVGSLRRMATLVHDIDIVCLPSGDGSTLDSILDGLIERGSLTPIRAGKKARCFAATKTGIQIDIYIADHRTWGTLLLIRTGSKNHNIKLAQRARELGFKLRASGDGIETESGTVMAIETEQDIFRLLRLPYLEPEHRT
jgi:DNA polymerase (family X)